MKKIGLIPVIQMIVALTISYFLKTEFEKYHEYKAKTVKTNNSEYIKFKKYFYEGTIDSVTYGSTPESKYIVITVTSNNKQWILIREEFAFGSLDRATVNFNVIEASDLLTREEILTK